MSTSSGGARALPGEQFFRSTFRLMGHVAKADGRVTEREIAAARGVMQSLRLNAAQVQLAIALFTEGKQPEFDLEQELGALARRLSFASPRSCACSWRSSCALRWPAAT